MQKMCQIANINIVCLFTIFRAVKLYHPRRVRGQEQCNTKETCVPHIFSNIVLFIY